MIPKTIHYCWFSSEKYPPKIKECIRSWKRNLPDYKLRLWDANSFDFQSIPYMKKCYDMHKWAYVADYIRLYAIYNEGGIYLDSDVLVLRTFDSLLDCNAFWGIDAMDEHRYAFPEAAIFGAVKGFEVLQEMMEYYHQLDEKNITADTFARLSNVWDKNNCSIFDEKGRIQLVTAPVVMENVLKKYGYQQRNTNQILKNSINIWAEPIIQNHKKNDTNETIAHHLNASSWLFTDRGPLFRFCHNHPFWMPFYKKIETINQRKR